MLLRHWLLLTVVIALVVLGLTLIVLAVGSILTNFVNRWFN